METYLPGSAAQTLRLLVAGSLLSLVFWIVGNEVVRSRSRIPGLKGPRGWPVIGNLLDIRENAAVKYQEWSRKYGDVFQVQLGNTTIVMVNSAAAAKALFLSNSQAMSSRPVTYTFHKVASTTAGLTIGASPYDDSLKRKKKGIAVALNRPSVQSYIPYLDLETKTFIQDLMEYGEAGSVAINPLRMIQRLSLSLVMTINWGVRVPSIRDELFNEIVRVEEELNRARSTVGNAQDHVPLLRLNPLNATSATAREMRRRRDQYLARLNGELAAKMEAGQSPPCIQASVIRYKEAALTRAELTAISLSALGGGFETVANTTMWTMAYLAQHPEAQDKAYAEIRKFREDAAAAAAADDDDDSEALPDAADDQKCQYVLAFAKEALRYFDVIPLALPRVSIKDVVYEGVRIPAGSNVYMNAWACDHDPELWSDPYEFRPERWIEKPDAPGFSFGLGYRMCAGHMLAMRELYLIFMRLLSSFRLEAVGDIKCDPSCDMSVPTDLIMAPKPYKLLCVPRDPEKLKKALDA